MSLPDGPDRGPRSEEAGGGSPAGPPPVSPSAIYNLIKPSRCDLRIWLGAHGVEEEPPGAFRELLFELGHRHEARHLERFPRHLDIAELPVTEQAAATTAALAAGKRVIYQGRLEAEVTVDGREIQVVGHPDFMLPARRGWAVRDSKLNRRVNDYIRLQLHAYGWLYERATGAGPVALQVHSGSGQILDVPYEPEGVAEALALLARIAELREAGEPPDEHISVSKCAGCGFRRHCWPPALARGEVGILPWFDRGLVEELHARGTHTARELVERWDTEALAALERPWGPVRKPVGERAGRLLKSAEANLLGEPIVLKRPALPEARTWVMFDLEGMPPQLDQLEKVYIWGLQCFGEQPGPFRPAVAGFGSGGDRQGWLDFLAEAELILAEHGDVPFVHWAAYERTKIDLYIDRYGDPAGTAERIKASLLDLLPITYEAVAVPRSSYSLKEIETLTGYERTLTEYGGDWSMARYIEATETEDRRERAAIMDQILAYNREDLEATWAVLEWLRELS